MNTDRTSVHAASEARIPSRLHSPPALLEGWSAIAAALALRSRRIASEGYLRTATEIRSVRELAKSIGYRPRPGLAAGVFLVYTLEPDAEVRLAAGSKVHSPARSGERAKTFETAGVLDARGRWNNLRIRDTRPPNGTGAEMPFAADLPEAEHAGATVLALDGIYDGLAPGRLVLVSGTRTDLEGIGGVEQLAARGVELAKIVRVEHRTDPAIAADRGHTFITLSTRLTYRYARAGFTIAANVVRATHGETHSEVIGSGDAAQTHQRFTLAAGPLTFVPARTSCGARSTLTVCVDGIPWSETSDLATAGPADRVYTAEADGAATAIRFGDGVRGARLPTGEDNVRASYRVGLGAEGNVPAGTLVVLAAPPAGVKAVINPLPAGGGADAESLDDVRLNAPATLLVPGRLGSPADFAQFARTFAGVAKATAAWIGPAQSGPICVTLAGQDGAAVDSRAELAVNLAAALRRLADPRQAFRLETFDRVTLLIGATVDLAPDADWETVEPAIRAALGETFGFATRDFGQAAFKSEAIAAIARVAGVSDVVLELFTGVSAATRLPLEAQRTAVDDAIVPLLSRPLGAAQIVFLEPDDRSAVELRNGAGAAP